MTLVYVVFLGDMAENPTLPNSKTYMKPGKKAIKAQIKFEMDELELLQENTSRMAESFGLDNRIANLTRKRKVGFYSWDSECLESVVSGIQDSPKNNEIAERIARKIEEGYKCIESKQDT